MTDRICHTGGSCTRPWPRAWPPRARTSWSWPCSPSRRPDSATPRPPGAPSAPPRRPGHLTTSKQTIVQIFILSNFCDWYSCVVSMIWGRARICYKWGIHSRLFPRALPPRVQKDVFCILSPCCNQNTSKSFQLWSFWKALASWCRQNHNLSK